MTFQECEKHPLWHAFKTYCQWEYGWPEQVFKDFSQAFWIKRFRLFLAGAEAEHRRLLECT